MLSEVRVDYPRLPVVLFAGKGSQEIASHAISAGVIDYLQKSTDPCQFELLAHSLPNAVDWAANERLVRQVYDAIYKIERGSGSSAKTVGSSA